MPPSRRCFAVGDVQGCLTPLRQLLNALAFDPTQDHLIVVGDLVNRGPASLETLRFLRSLGTAATCLLGNHDLHLLAAARGGRFSARDTLQQIMAAEDRDALLQWLRARPLACWHDDTQTLLIHAGLPPQWTAPQALALAREVSAVLQSAEGDALLDQLYGNEPDHWDERLQGIPRWRFVINALTRLRMVDAQGRLALRHKGSPEQAAGRGLRPWFQADGRRSQDTRIVFGHWSMLGRVHWPESQVFGLDTGCVWGGRLTALELFSGVLRDQPCPAACAPDEG
jgi:bis(5'-nucleosyl)-tetraphosphatase (symmetrical)